MTKDHVTFRLANASCSRLSAHLVLHSGTESANEVAQIINEKNNSLKEGVARKARLKQNAKSY